MKRHLHIQGPDVSIPSRWKNEGGAFYVINRRIALKKFGKAIALSGLVKHGALVKQDDAHKLVALLRTSGNNCHIATLAQNTVRRKLLGDEKNWQRPTWYTSAWFRESEYDFTHALHVSTEDPEQVAFAPTMDRLMAEKYIRMKPGKYLKRFFGDVLDDDEIKQYAEEHVACFGKVELKFATTTDEFVRVVNFGPSESCMSAAYNGNDEHWYAGPEHPAAAYHQDDIEIAYFEVKEDGKPKVNARCICNKKKKFAARAYGDANRLLVALQAAGYVQKSGALIGCRLHKITDDYETYVMPYVDAGTGSGGGALGYRDDGDWFTLTHDNEDGTTADGNSENGVTTPGSSYRCDSCGDRCDKCDLNYVECDEVSVCEYCLSEHYVYAYTKRHQEYVRNDDAVYCKSDGEYYHEDYMNEHDVYECQITNRWYHIDDLVFVTSQGGYVYHDYYDVVALDVEDSDGNSYAMKDETVTDHQGRTCMEEDCIEHDGEWYHKDDTTQPLPFEEVVTA